MSMRELVVDDTHYFMDVVNDNVGDHYIKDGITTVLDFRNPLVVVYKNMETHVHPLVLGVNQDKNGNDIVAIPLAEDITLYIRGLFYIDTAFIKQFEDTYLHELVKNKEGCYAVSGFEILENNSEP
jgi:hypothetical protein